MNIEGMNIAAAPRYDASIFDDDGRPKRTGTAWTAGAHIITAVIGSGVLTLAWAIAQMGWIAGPASIIVFSLITLLTSSMLADCYRGADGTRNYVYKDVVNSYLGGVRVQVCAVTQYSYLVGVSVGYSITTAISLVAMKKSICFHKHGHNYDCTLSNNPYIILFGSIQVVLSQLQDFHKLSILSTIATLMSFGYASIGFSLSIAKIAEGKEHVETSLTGRKIGSTYTAIDKMWNCFAAIGNIAFSYAFAVVLIEIQDTLRAGEPESKVMKQASTAGILISTAFYLLCGVLGYAAFGNDAPGNFLTGFGFYDPYWLIFIANLFIAVHLLGAYQIFCQPIFAAVESSIKRKWPMNNFINAEYSCGSFSLNWFRLIWRSLYVVFVTFIAMLLPFFNDFVGLLGAVSFWPLAVFLPIEMYLERSKVSRWSGRGMLLMVMSAFCLIASLLALAGSVRGLILSVESFKPLESRS